MYSSIVRRGCKGNCGRMPDMGGKGWCFVCKPEYKQEIIDKTKKRNAAKLAGQKIRTTISASDGNVELKKDYGKLDIWFKERRKEMTNTCSECGKGTNKNNDKYYKWSCCHIVPKGLIKSVATNEFNFIELCQLHHQEFDSTFDRAEKMMCFVEIKMKFQLFKHLIPPEELRRINPHLLT